MFVCLSVGYTLVMGKRGIYRGRFLSKNELNPNNASPFMSENVTLISFYHTFFLSHVGIEDILKVEAIYRFFFVYLTSRASDAPKSANRLSDVWQFNDNERYP